MATDVSSTISVYESDMGPSQIANSPFGYKEILVETIATADGAASDTFALTLADYGITTLLSVSGFQHTTNYSVVVPEAVTTAVLAGVLTVTLVNASAGKRVVLIGGI